MQMEVSKFFTPRNLQKVKLVDQGWIGVEKVFKKITPMAGLFENKNTSEIFFETKQNSWTQKDIIESFPFDHDFLGERLIEERQWNRIFYFMITGSEWCAAPDFLRALAEIVDVNALQDRYQHTSLHLATRHGDIDLLKILLERPGADPNLRDYRGESPLYEAMCWHMILSPQNPLAKLIRNVKELFSQSQSLNSKIQLTTLQRKQLEFMELLFFHGATVDEAESTLISQLQILGIRFN